MIGKINECIGRAVSWLAPVMVAVAFAVVVLRYGFQYGRVDMQESILYLHAAIVALCMGYTLARDDHVRVDIFYSRMSERARAVVNLAGDVLFLLPTCAAILYSSWDYTAISWRFMERSPEPAGLPGVFLLKTLIPLMAVLLMVQAAARIAPAAVSAARRIARRRR